MRTLWLLSLSLALTGCRPRWGAHDEHALCQRAVRGSVQWPANSCMAMHMCANEASLSSSDQAALTSAMSARGCPR
jgi:hypothetical protein